MTDAPLVINELQVAGANGNDEFVEIYNKSSSAIDFGADYELLYQSASGSTLETRFAGQLMIPAGGYVVLGGSSWSGVKNGDLTNGLGNNGGQLMIRRRADRRKIDGVGWGNITGGECAEGVAVVAPSANKSLARVPNGADSDDNARDFAVRDSDARTPGAANL